MVDQRQWRSKRGARDAPPPVQILSISCSFWENLSKIRMLAPPGELAPPHQEHPLVDWLKIFLSLFLQKI